MVSIDVIAQRRGVTILNQIEQELAMRDIRSGC